MLSPPAEPIEADIHAWIEAAGDDPVLRLRRRVSHIVLAAISLSPRLGGQLVFKGGALMAIGYGSPRNTSDLDFTAKSEPAPFAEMLSGELNEYLKEARIRIGSLDIECLIQNIAMVPEAEKFPHATTPIIIVTVGYFSSSDISNDVLEIRRQQLISGRATDNLKIDISFNERVCNEQKLYLKKASAALHAYAAEEVIAEKMRALLQQVGSEPGVEEPRRQDVFDIYYFLTTRTLDQASQAIILKTLVEKCKGRGLEPKQDSMDNPEVRRLARKEWATLADELEELPDFDPLFEQVRAFYASLPWHTLS